MVSVYVVVWFWLSNDVICFVHAEMEKHKKLMFPLYILHSQEHYINYRNCVNVQFFLFISIILKLILYYKGWTYIMGVRNYMIRIFEHHMEEVTGFHTVTFKVVRCSLMCAQVRDRWLALVSAVMNIWVP